MRDFPASATASGRQSNPVRSGAPLWKQAVAFGFGFCIQFNVLVGGSGEGAAAVGGFGFRLIDLMSAAVLGLLAVYALAPRRILPLAAFSLFVVFLFLLPALSSDQRTATLAVHYVLYSIAALYVVLILGEGQTLDRFCWGLLAGLLATIPIFVLQGLGYTSKLIELGLIPGYFYSVLQTNGDVPRYAGLWGHPNEAGHISALAAAAGAYLAFVRGRIVALCLVAGGLVTVFYYTQTRGALIAGGVVLAIPLLFSGSGRVSFLRRIVLAGLVIAGIVVTTQAGFISDRFADDPTTSGNFMERLDSTLFGLGLVLSNPFGLPTTEFASLMSAGTGGVATPHNGFIYFAGIFGLLPFAAVAFAFAANLRIREDGDAFFAFLALQVGLSCMFEQVPGSYSYAFVICMMLARAFLKTRIGEELRSSSNARHNGRLIKSRRFASHDMSIASRLKQDRSS